MTWICPVIQRTGSPLTAKIMQGSSRLLADFRSRLSGGAWLSPSCCGRFSRFGCDRFSRFGCGRLSRFSHGFNRSRQFRLRRFRSAMVAMVQRLDARGFFFRPQLSVCTVSALVLKVFRNRSSCHGCSVAELSSSALSNFGHSLTIHGLPRGDWTETCYRQPSTLEILAGEGSCFDTALVGVIFLHGQEGDQFPKTNRAFCHLDVRRMLAAAGFSSSLRLEGFLRQQSHAITMLSCRSILDQFTRRRFCAN